MRIDGNGVTIGGIVAMIGGIVATMSARPGVNTWKSVAKPGKPGATTGTRHAITAATIAAIERGA